MADHSPEPAPNRLPDDSLQLSAHDALRLVSGTGLDHFFQCLPATVWTTDTALTLTFVQGDMLDKWQVAPEKLIGRTLPDLVLDGREDHPLVQGHHTALSGHETSVRIEWGGNLYNARIAPLRDASGVIVGCVGSHQQIGWLPDDDGLLRESDMRLRRIIDSNMIGIAFGNDEGQITEANEAFLHLAGYTREDLVADGISWPALTPVECHPRQLAAIDEVRQTGRCTPFEVDLIRKDGTIVPVLVGGARLSARRREGVAFVLDISERRSLRRRLSAELACADALLDTPVPGDAVRNALVALCDALGWKSAEFWQQDEANVPVPHAHTNDRAASLTATSAAVQRAHTTSEAQWLDSARMVVVPIAGESQVQSAVVVGGLEVLEPWVIETVQAVGLRIVKFLARRSA